MTRAADVIHDVYLEIWMEMRKRKLSYCRDDFVFFYKALDSGFFIKQIHFINKVHAQCAKRKKYNCHFHTL